jgi:hypothetical protein
MGRHDDVAGGVRRRADVGVRTMVLAFGRYVERGFQARPCSSAHYGRIWQFVLRENGTPFSFASFQSTECSVVIRIATPRCRVQHDRRLALLLALAALRRSARLSARPACGGNQNRDGAGGAAVCRVGQPWAAMWGIVFLVRPLRPYSDLCRSCTPLWA